MSLDKIEAFIEFAHHLEKEHDIPFTMSRVSEWDAGRNSRPIHMLRKDYGDSYPHTICEYDEEHGMFHYQLVGDNKYYYRLKKNDGAVNNKDTLTSLRDECKPIFDDLSTFITGAIPRKNRDTIFSYLFKISEIINTTEKE